MSSEPSKNLKTDMKIKLLQFLHDIQQTNSGIMEQSPTGEHEMRGSQKFNRAFANLQSNPFHEEPITEVESLEDFLAIDNINQVTDQVR